MLAIFISMHKVRCTFLLLKMCHSHKLQHTCLCQLVPVAIAIVARATPFLSVDSMVRLTATIVEAGTLGTSAG